MEENRNTRKENKQENPYHISYENYLDTNASTECTGLMPNGADDRMEWDAYREIFDFIPIPPLEEDTGK